MNVKEKRGQRRERETEGRGRGRRNWRCDWQEIGEQQMKSGRDEKEQRRSVNRDKARRWPIPRTAKSQ